MKAYFWRAPISSREDKGSNPYPDPHKSQSNSTREPDTRSKHGHGGRGHRRRRAGLPPPSTPPWHCLLGRGSLPAAGGGGVRVVRGWGRRDGDQGGDDDLLRPGDRQAGAGDRRRIPGGRERGDPGEDGGHRRVRRRAGRVPRRARGQAHAPGAGTPRQGRRAAAAAPPGVPAHRRRRVRARPAARLRRALQGGRPRRRLRQLHWQGFPRWHQEAQFQAWADDARFQEPQATGFHWSGDDTWACVQGEEDAREDGRNQDQDQEAQDCQDRQRPPGPHDQRCRAGEAREPPPHRTCQDRRQEHPKELDFFWLNMSVSYLVENWTSFCTHATSD